MHAQPAQLSLTSARRSSSSVANRSLTPRREVLTSIAAPVSGSTNIRCPTLGKLAASRGSTISTARTEWRTRNDPSGRSQAR